MPCQVCSEHPTPHRLVAVIRRQCVHGGVFGSGWDRCGGSDDDDDESPRVEVAKRPPDSGGRAPALRTAVSVAAAQATTPDPAAEADTAPVPPALPGTSEACRASAMPLGQLPSPEHHAVVMIKTEQLSESPAAAVSLQPDADASLSSPPRSIDVATCGKSLTPTSPDNRAYWWGSVYASAWG